MPEGPEVRHFADCLRAAYKGQSLIEVLSYSPHHDAALALEIGSVLRDVYSYGKKIIFDFGTQILINSLIMKGSWGTQTEYVRLQLVFEVGTASFTDSRHWGYSELITRDQLATFLTSLGPDVVESALHGGLNETQWDALWERKRKSRMKLHAILLDQHFLAGIGNYLRAEILYRARLNPYHEIRNLTKSQSNTLKEVLFTVVRDAYLAKIGEARFEKVVYKQKYDPDGHKVRQDKVGKRSLWWVPEVQI